ncbi:MAG TPA: GntR family transcriptional regulator [Roseiflexaceae bacterium]|nr:GntR family transcriptional regulator [Roseiflexaceae bacterium]
MLDLDRMAKELQAPAAAPLHLRLRGALQAQIADGTLQPGELLPPERALQEHLGISRATVRQAIKNLVDTGMLKSVVGAGTFVLERRETPSERNLVGIIVPDAAFYIYYANLASSLGFQLREAGYRVDMSIHNDRYETLTEIVDSLVSQQVAGVVIVAPNQGSIEPLIHQLRAHGIIVLLLTRYLEGFPDVNYVGADNERIGYEAAQHLIQLGHTSIVHVAGTRSSTAHDRANGYIRALREAQLIPQLFIPPLERGYDLAPDLAPFSIGTDETQLWFSIARREITAAFCFNDATASWVQKEIRNLNLVIPRDLSLIGVDNMPYADFFDAPLTTFALPGEEIGKEAAKLLLRRLNGETFPRERTLLPARFIQRLSTAPPRLAPVLAR